MYTVEPLCKGQLGTSNGEVSSYQSLKKGTGK